MSKASDLNVQTGRKVGETTPEVSLSIRPKNICKLSRQKYTHKQHLQVKIHRLEMSHKKSGFVCLGGGDLQM